MKKKKTLKKLPKKKRLIKDCLDEWSLCVRERDKVCRICGSDQRLSAHHIRSVTHNSTKFDLENGICLCWSCHSQQKFHPERFQDSVIDVIGDEKYAALKRKSLQVVDYSTSDLEEKRDNLRRKLHDFKAGVDFDNIPF
jgi:hypothetical protein